MNTATNWAEIDVHSDAQLQGVVFLLDGVAFRARRGGAARGHVHVKNGAPVLVYSSGKTEPLTAALCQGLEFDLDPNKVDRTTGRARTKDELVAIAQACPAWAQRTVLQHLLPAETAAWEKRQQEARVAQLKATTRAATGKPAGNAVSGGQAARVEQLREIGRKVSAQR